MGPKRRAALEQMFPKPGTGQGKLTCTGQPCKVELGFGYRKKGDICRFNSGELPVP
jgi:hypothetical protein